MPRFTAARTIAVLSCCALDCGCSRGQSNHALTGPPRAPGAGRTCEGGPITPGSSREFSSRIAVIRYISTPIASR